LAAKLVHASADAAWRNRSVAPGGPLFGPDWSRPAAEPGRRTPERDLSVQLGAWMTLEAAATLR
jgi:predicted alpha-1,6-mannanase (GH76 family)